MINQNQPVPMIMVMIIMEEITATFFSNPETNRHQRVYMIIQSFFLQQILLRIKSIRATIGYNELI